MNADHFDALVDNDPDGGQPDYRIPGNVQFALMAPLTTPGGTRKGWSVEVLDYDRGGCPDYEQTHGGFLDHTILELLCLGPLRLEDDDDDPRAGLYVMEGLVGVFCRGDMYTTDDDMSFEHSGIRRMTPEEAAQHDEGAKV